MELGKFTFLHFENKQIHFSYTDDLNFFQRGYNFLSYLKEIYIHQHLILRRIDKLSEKHYPGKLVEAFYMERNASINFVNHPPIFDFARPYMPRARLIIQRSRWCTWPAQASISLPRRIKASGMWLPRECYSGLEVVGGNSRIVISARAGSNPLQTT
jgi:hypothetical protein